MRAVVSPFDESQGTATLPPKIEFCFGRTSGHTFAFTGRVVRMADEFCKGLNELTPSAVGR